MANKLLVICGPTATGKTDLGIRLAKKYNGEIVSADSRQVYKGMDIISGKDLPENSKLEIRNSKLGITNNKLEVGYRLKDEIPVWLVDIVEPNYPFNVGEYAKLAHAVISDIWSRNKLPIVVGGTGFYIRAILGQIETVIIPPNKKLRTILTKYTKDQLQTALRQNVPDKWGKMNPSDRENPRRLVRAIEVAAFYHKHKNRESHILNPLRIDSQLLLGLRASFPFLYKRIDKRVEKRVKNGAVDEIKALLPKKYSWFLPAFSAAGCRELKEYLEGKSNLADALKSWKFQEHMYARKQMTWFKKDKRIKWFDITNYDCGEKIEELVAKWYTDKN